MLEGGARFIGSAGCHEWCYVAEDAEVVTNAHVSNGPGRARCRCIYVTMSLNLITFEANIPNEIYLGA